MEVIDEILREHKLKRQFQFDEVTTKWLESQFQTMFLKLQ